MKVNLQDIENTLIDLNQRFNLRELCYDPWNATHMAQRLQSGGMGTMAKNWQAGSPPGIASRDRMSKLPMVEIPAVAKYLQAQATAVIEAFNDGRIHLFEDADLRRDLNRFRLEHCPTVSVSQARGMSLAMVTWEALFVWRCWPHRSGPAASLPLPGQ